MASLLVLDEFPEMLHTTVFIGVILWGDDTFYIFPVGSALVSLNFLLELLELLFCLYLPCSMAGVIGSASSVEFLLEFII